MRIFQLMTVVALLLAGAAAAQTTTPKPQSVADYLRQGRGVLIVGFIIVIGGAVRRLYQLQGLARSGRHPRRNVA
ncbi:MAG: hypothetical protein WDN06_09835 [Asticcacaulis sp.]